jgi:RNA polymerase sigma factor (sigma-70 family)
MRFDVLVKRISPTLKRITRRLNGHHSFFNDEDLYQEALTRLWVDYGRGGLEDKTDSYILQGCYYHLRNYLRKNQENAIFLSLGSPIGEDGVRPEDFLSLQDSSFVEKMESDLQLELAGQTCFTDRERTILALFMEGMSMREIGNRLGISHVMVLKIRNRIKEKYGKFHQEASN